MPAKTKSEKRESIRRKQKSAPKGGTRAAQKRRQETSKNYKGRVKKMIKK